MSFRSNRWIVSLPTTMMGPGVLSASVRTTSRIIVTTAACDPEWALKGSYLHSAERDVKRGHLAITPAKDRMRRSISNVGNVHRRPMIGGGTQARWSAPRKKAGTSIEAVAGVTLCRRI
ncbi:hypothetical protein DFH08DRAFT_900712 [Mycena albidolilacea]|uniref:Uncharacterized protein n=1 Tax=Mycena albidolilacea TaxID=1033008 RepID=A0AAD6Z586_9AGAR|nr:hypothetical protein DFH08DRAFT_900712 [Mycena albidolilacea]